MILDERYHFLDSVYVLLSYVTTVRFHRQPKAVRRI